MYTIGNKVITLIFCSRRKQPVTNRHLEQFLLNAFNKPLWAEVLWSPMFDKMLTSKKKFLLCQAFLAYPLILFGDLISCKYIIKIQASKNSLCTTYRIDVSEYINEKQNCSKLCIL